MLLHGFASDRFSWAPLEAHLSAQRVIRIELPCHGNSPLRVAGGFADLVKDVRRVLDGLNLENAHLVGHSLGGAVSLAIADTRARGLCALTLLAPAGLGPEINGEALSGILRARRAESLRPWLKTLVADEDLITEAYARHALAARQDPQIRGAQEGLAEMLFPDGVQAFDLRAALQRLTLPTRIIWGRRDRVIPWRQALHAPGSVALHLVDGVGHVPQLEAPELVAQIIKRAI